MKRKHQRTLELIFVRPVSGSLPWRDVLALFQELGAEISEREGSRVAVVLFDEVRVFHKPHPTPRRTPTRELSLPSGAGLNNT